MMRSVFERLIFRADRHLRPYERACIDAFIERLPIGAPATAVSQVNSIDLVYRESRDKLVVMDTSAGKGALRVPEFANHEIESHPFTVAL